jgi:GlcNAc-P-P-Und epimerase
MGVESTCKQRVLVTGSSGFIAAHLCRALKKAGCMLTGLDKNDFNENRYLEKAVKGDIRSKGAVEESIKGVESVFHLAAAHHDFGITEETFFDVNVDGTKTLLDACARQDVKKVFFFSSVAVYGPHNRSPNEKSRTVPDAAYGRSKLEAENLVRDWVLQASGRSGVVIRPAVVFGPGNKANMNNLIRQIAKRRFVSVGNGRNIKSIAYIDNLIEAVLFVVERMRPGVATYNYSDYPQLTTNDLTELIAREVGVGLWPIRLPVLPALLIGKVLDAIAEHTGANLPITGKRIQKFISETCFISDQIRELGFKQPISIEDGVARMVDWMGHEGEL